MTQGFFTSMNQALVGAMTGAAVAEQRPFNRKNLTNIFKGWLISPISGFIFCWLAYRALL